MYMCVLIARISGYPKSLHVHLAVICVSQNCSGRCRAKTPVGAAAADPPVPSSSRLPAKANQKILTERRKSADQRGRPCQGGTEHIGRGIEEARAYVVVKIAAVVNGGAVIGRLSWHTLAGQNQLTLLQRHACYLDMETLQSFRPQICNLEGIGLAPMALHKTRDRADGSTKAKTCASRRERPHGEVDRIINNRNQKNRRIAGRHVC